MTLKSPRHILRSEQFDRAFLEKIFAITDVIRKFDKSKEGILYLASLLPHKQVMLYFTQPSTRTFLSFQSACHILGCKTSEVRNTEVSSEKKGESIEDSLRTFSSYVDLIIMRSPVPGLCERIAKTLDATPRPVPIINAGSGPDEHPTQALLDLYTLHRSFLRLGGIEGKTICMVGDLLRGRTVRSLSKLLCLFPGVHLIFSSPNEFKIAKDLRTYLKGTGQITFSETTNFEEAIAAADAIYMTRIQDEYDLCAESSKVAIEKYFFRPEHLKVIKKDAVLLHPMPRRQELDPAVDLDPRAKYWRQERNGMWVRVALITHIFGEDHKILLPDL